MGKRILLVEGKDDLHVVSHLCMKHSMPERFKIECPKENESGDRSNGGGIDNLFEVLKVLLDDGDLECLAIIVDADVDIEARWASLRDRVQNHVLLPLDPNPDGTIVEISDDFRKIRFAIWIMPNNQLPGILEDFAAFLIPADDSNLPRVDQFLESIPSGQRKFKDARRPKARIHAWLAVQEQPGRPLGTAIMCRYLDADHQTVDVFMRWLRAALVE